MRLRILLTLPFALAFLPLPALAADIIAESHISAVTVYPDRATVTRSAVFDLPAGASTLVFNGLPAELFPDSLRTEGSAAGDVVLGALESKTVNSAELAAPRERELNSQLQTLNDQRELLVADQQAISKKQEFLATLSQQASLRTRENIAEIDLKPEQWKGAAESLQTGLSEALRALAVKTVELRQIDEKIAALQSELGRLQTGARAVYQVRIPLESRSATRLTLQVSYQLGGATWSPIYDARLDTATARVSLTQFGEVRQQTGEDWTDAKLTLSTAQPARGAALPPLEPMWVALYQQYAEQQLLRDNAVRARSNLAGQSVAAPAMMAMESADSAITGAPPMKAAAFQAAIINTGGYVSEYVIPGQTTVLADGTARKVMIGTLDVTSNLLVKIKPQISAAGFLVAVTKLGGEAPLLPGTASLFRDGAYIGSMNLPLLRPGEETDLSFGIDDQVVVKQRVLKDESGESGVISRDNTRTRYTVSEVQNLRRQPVRIALLQTVPVPRDEQIKLQLIEGQTSPGYAKDVDNIPGQLRWNFDLTPQQKQEIKLGWTLSWPKDQNLSGLPF